MESKPSVHFNCDSLRADVSRISAVLKNENDDDYSGNVDVQSDRSNNAETGEFGTEPLEHFGESVIGEISNDPASARPTDSEPFDVFLQNCAMLKEWIVTSIQKLDNVVNEADKKQEQLADKLEVATRMEYEEKKKIKYYKPINLFATPYFRDVRGSVPPPNEDSINKRINGDVDAYTAPPRPWTAPERKYLRDAVIESARRQQLEPLVASREYYKNKLEHGIISDEQAADIEEKLHTIVEEIGNISEKSEQELLSLPINLDWMRIAASLPDITRTPDQCERMWHNYVHPSINKRRWTEEEDNELRRVAAKHRYQDWEQIARELTLSKRTAIQCLQRYQSALNPDMLKSIWTQEDDEELLHVVEACRNGNYIPWNQVCYHIPGRRRLQIVNRWTRSIAPFLKKTPWSPEEDAILLAAVDRYGYKWAKIKDLLPGRSNFSCRERYTNVLAPGVIVGNWTPEEDRLLVKLARQNPDGKWSKIAENFEGRTDNMCLQRVTRIRKHHPHLFDPDVAFSDIEGNLETEELFTPTHNCKALNTNRENIRLAAEESLVKTIMRVRGYQTVEEAKEALKSMKASRTFLFQLSRELLREEGQNAHQRNAQKQAEKSSRTVRKKGVRKTAVQTKGSRKRKRVARQSHRSELFDDETETETDTMSFHDEEDEEEFSERREDSEEEFYTEDTGATVNYVRTEEDDVVDAELDSLFLPLLVYGLRNTKRRKCVYQSAKHVLELKLVKSSLYKALHCTADRVSDEDETHEGTKIRGIDYAMTLPPVMKNFVFDPSVVKEIPVFPPNHLSLEIFKILLINYRQMQYFLSQNPCKDTHVLSIISSQEKYTLVCAYCYKTKNYESQSDVVVNIPYPEDFSEDNNSMNSPAESTSNSELCNGEHVNSEDSVTLCSDCVHLNQLRKDFHLLRKRLFSLFFWPALLTTIKPAYPQMISICDQDEAAETCNEKGPAKTSNEKGPAKKCVAKKRQRSTSKVRKLQSDTEHDTASAVEVVSSPPVKKRKYASKQVKKSSECERQVLSSNATRKSPRQCR